MITCPQCGAQNLPGLAYCETCGTPLPQQPAATSGASAAPQDAGQSSLGPSPTALTGAPPDPAAAAMPQPVMPVDQPPAAPDAGIPSPAAVGVDVGSTNGTYVNGRAVPYNQPTPLHDGDTLSFGALNTHVSIT